MTSCSQPTQTEKKCDREEKKSFFNYLAREWSTYFRVAECLFVSAPHDWHVPRFYVQALKIEHHHKTIMSIVDINNLNELFFHFAISIDSLKERERDKERGWGTNTTNQLSLARNDDDSHTPYTFSLTCLETCRKENWKGS